MFVVFCRLVGLLLVTLRVVFVSTGLEASPKELTVDQPEVSDVSGRMIFLGLMLFGPPPHVQGWAGYSGSQ